MQIGRDAGLCSAGNFNRKTASEVDMKLALLAAVVLPLSGCIPPAADDSSLRRAASSRSIPQVSTRSTSQPTLKEIEIRNGVYLARIEIHTTITPEGELRWARTYNKSYGPNDVADAKSERWERRQGRLTPQQQSELAKLFEDWDALPNNGASGVPDGGQLDFRYGAITLHGILPPKAKVAFDHIQSLAESMPLVKE